MSVAAEAIGTPASPPPGGDAPPAAPAAPAGDPASPAPPSEPSWQQKFLSPEWAGHEAIARYKSPDDLAKGHAETMAWARGRVAVPKADDAEGFGKFVEAVRPEKAEDYAIPVPEGQPSATADHFRKVFHEQGLLPQQATAVATAFNQFSADALSRVTQDSRDTLTAYEVEIGPAAYNQRLAAIEGLFKATGFDVGDVVPALEQVGKGAGPAIRFLAAIAEKTGELAKVDGEAVAIRMGAMSPEAAQARLDEMSRSTDQAFLKALGDPASPESKQRGELMKIVAAGRKSPR